MSDATRLALPHYSTSTVILAAAAVVIFLAVATAYLGRALIRRGMRQPRVVRYINNLSERVIAIVKRPITIAVLDEVAEVLRSGNYTRNIASALDENRVELREMITEKVLADSAASRSIGLLPFHERLITEVAEATLRIVFEVLSDPRTDELISDLLRDNIDQIRAAVRASDA